MTVRKSTNSICTTICSRPVLLALSFLCHALHAQEEPQRRSVAAPRSAVEVLFAQAEEMAENQYPSKDDLAKMRGFYMQSARAGYVPAMEVLLMGGSPSLHLKDMPSVEQEKISEAVAALKASRGTKTAMTSPGAVVQLKADDPDRAKIADFYALVAQSGNRAAFHYFASDACNEALRTGSTETKVEKLSRLAAAGDHNAASLLTKLYQSGSVDGMTAEADPAEAFKWFLLASYLGGDPIPPTIAQTLAQLTNNEIEFAQEAVEEMIRANNPPRRKPPEGSVEKAPNCMKALFAVAKELPPLALSESSALILPTEIIVANNPPPPWIASLLANPPSAVAASETKTASESAPAPPPEKAAAEPAAVETPKPAAASTATPLTKKDLEHTQAFAKWLDELGDRQALDKDEMEKLQPPLRQLARDGYIPAMEILLTGLPSQTLMSQVFVHKDRFPEEMQQEMSLALRSTQSNPQGMRSLRLTASDPDWAKLRSLYARVARYGNQPAVEYFAREALVPSQGTDSNARIEKCVQLASLGSAFACHALALLYQNGEHSGMKATPDPVLAFQWQLLNCYISGRPFSHTVDAGTPGNSTPLQSPAEMMARLSAAQIEQALQGAEKIILAHNPPRRDSRLPTAEGEPDCMKALHSVAAQLDKHIFSGSAAELTIEVPLSEAQIPDWLASVLARSQASTASAVPSEQAKPAPAANEPPRHPLQQQYETALADIAKTRDEQLAKIDTAFTANLDTAKAEVRKAFEPLFRNAKPAEAESYTNTLNKLIGAAPGAAASGGSFTQMTGKWVARDLNERNSSSSSLSRYHYLFDFGTGKEMVFEYSYMPGSASTSATYSKQTTKTKYNIQAGRDKIVITPVSPNNYIYLPGMRSNSESNQHSFEIQVPFDPSRPAMTYTDSGNTMTIKLERAQ